MRYSSLTGVSALVFTRILNNKICKNRTERQDQQSTEEKHTQNVFLVAGGLFTCLGWCVSGGYSHAL